LFAFELKIEDELSKARIIKGFSKRCSEILIRGANNKKDINEIKRARIEKSKDLNRLSILVELPYNTKE
jgi:hypothetical protein